ncbi:hypothetical protein MMM2322_00347 [Microbacterium sp. MM2322]
MWSARSLEQAATGRLVPAQASDAERERIDLLHGSSSTATSACAGSTRWCSWRSSNTSTRRDSVRSGMLSSRRPLRSVVVTTPNAEYNALYPDLPAGTFRHDDHRFEWTRDEFRAWAEGVAGRHGYAVEFRPVGRRGMPTSARPPNSPCSGRRSRHDRPRHPRPVARRPRRGIRSRASPRSRGSTSAPTKRSQATRSGGSSPTTSPTSPPPRPRSTRCSTWRVSVSTRDCSP